MKIRWLKELVYLNRENGSQASALAAQQHICALIAVVIEHTGDAMDCDLNLMVAQPVQKDCAIRPREFRFIDSVLDETFMDFRALSEDCKFVTSDFTVDYLSSEIAEVIEIATVAGLFYSLRPLLSFQLRIAAGRSNFQGMAGAFKKLAGLYKKLSAVGTATHATEIAFVLVGWTRVYAMGTGAIGKFGRRMMGQSIVPLTPVDGIRVGFEHPHCWDTFEVPVTVHL
jgi:hypothetical protein